MNTSKKLYLPCTVNRSDAGGRLYAPGYYVDNVLHESGDTPSYDREAIQRRCDELNVANVGKPVTPDEWRELASKTFCWGVIELQLSLKKHQYGVRFGGYRWFKTRAAATIFAKQSLQYYAIAKAEL